MYYERYLNLFGDLNSIEYFKVLTEKIERILEKAEAKFYDLLKN